MTRLHLSLAFAVALTTPILAGQNLPEAQPAPDEQVFRAHSDLVVLHVNVFDGRSDAVPDLPQQATQMTGVHAADGRLIATAGVVHPPAWNASGLGRAIPALIQALNAHQDILVQTAAANALRGMKAVDSVPTIKKVIETYLQTYKHDHFTMTRSHQRGLFIACIDALKAIGTMDSIRFANKVESAARTTTTF